MDVPRPMTPELVTADAVDSLSRLLELGATLDPQEWRRPTDCPGWDVHDVVAHVVGFEAMLDGSPNPDAVVDDEHVHNEIGSINQAWVESMRQQPHDALLEDLAALADRRRTELAELDLDQLESPVWSPVGEVPRKRFLQIRTFDVWFHEQDVREATGRPGGMDGGVAERAMTELASSLGYVVGKRGGVPDGESVRFELAVPEPGAAPLVLDVAVRGRARLVDDLDGDPTVTIATDLATFTRLAGGRRDPQVVLDDGRIRFAGDAALGEQVIGHLAYVI